MFCGSQPLRAESRPPRADVPVQLVVQRHLVDLAQQRGRPVQRPGVEVQPWGPVGVAPDVEAPVVHQGREGAQLGHVVVHGQAQLLEIVLALGPPGRLAGRLHGRQQKCDENGDDGDDDQQLDQCEASRARMRCPLLTMTRFDNPPLESARPAIEPPRPDSPARPAGSPFAPSETARPGRPNRCLPPLRSSATRSEWASIHLYLYNVSDGNRKQVPDISQRGLPTPPVARMAASGPDSWPRRGPGARPLMARFPGESGPGGGGGALSEPRVSEPTGEDAAPG